MSNKSINDKELLTFCNLTNLEWEFVNLEEPENLRGMDTDSGDLGEGVSTQLNEILTPEVFYRENEERYIYGDKETGELDEEAGRKELKKEAGIAMEYKELLDEGEESEGTFLQDWEVIYGADNYKLVAD